VSDAPVAPPSDLQPRRAYKPLRTRKAPTIQNAVLAKRANGSSKAKISKELGIAHNTVTNILELSNFDRSLDLERQNSLELIPLAIRTAKHRLSQNSENMAIKVLENTIWPLNAKQSKAPDAGLTIAIQNLMQVQAPQPEKPAIDIAPEPAK
jgi:hypothetical protein